MEINETQISQWLTLISKFMNRFAWLADSYVLDFYTHEHWSNLPSSWSEFLVTVTPEDLADIIDPQTTTIRKSSGGHMPPLSLLAFKKSVSVLSLERKYDEDAFKIWLNRISKQSRDSEFTEFKNLFRRHVKLKKRHEVEQVGRIVSALSCSTNAGNVFDIGSGLGHLSRYLTYSLNLGVTCVDKEQRFGVGASKFDTQLESFLSKKNPKTLPKPPSHANELLRFDHHTRLFNETTDGKFGFTGLHACGNLSPLILHNFVNSKADFVVSFGCCYMKMDQIGFPLSDHAKAIRLSFSYEALEVACHAIEQYCERLRSNQVNKLITHSYRATLETILIRHGIKHAGLRGVPHTETLTFQEYALRAIAKLPTTLPLTLAELESEQVTTHLNDWFKVVLFYSLRLMMATVVESAVLLDRALYINSKTKETRTYVMPCFESSISARNLGVISLRL